MMCVPRFGIAFFGVVVEWTGREEVAGLRYSNDTQRRR